MSARRPYSTDLFGEEWQTLEPLILSAEPAGRPQAH